MLRLNYFRKNSVQYTLSKNHNRIFVDLKLALGSLRTKISENQNLNRGSELS